MNTSRTAMRGEAITAWNRWGHNRPRAWLVRYGGVTGGAGDCKEVTAEYRRVHLLASQAARPTTRSHCTTDPRFDAA